MEHFSTPRLIARDWTTADAQGAFAIYGRDEVARWLGAPPRRPAASVEAMQASLEHTIAHDAAVPQFGLWALELRSSGTLIGAVLLRPLPGGDGEVEIGWHLNPDHWGHGYATEAARGALERAFGECGLAEVLAVVDPDNTRSIAVCRRLGMTHLGQTDRYFGVTFELFRIRDEAREPGGEASEPGGEASEPGGEAREPGGGAREPGGEAPEPGGEAS
jgi:RimJ/RimL family protein N-acetyltransferase